MKILTTLIVASVASLGGYRVWESQSASKHKAAQPAPAIAASNPSPAATIPDLLSGDGSRAPAAAAKESDATQAAKPATPEGVEFEESDLITAVEQGVIKATLRANGHDRAVANLSNNSPTPLKVSAPAGQILENG